MVYQINEHVNKEERQYFYGSLSSCSLWYIHHGRISRFSISLRGQIKLVVLCSYLLVLLHVTFIIFKYFYICSVFHFILNGTSYFYSFFGQAGFDSVAKKIRM